MIEQAIIIDIYPPSAQPPASGVHACVAAAKLPCAGSAIGMPCMEHPALVVIVVQREAAL